jgi:hypothetical protein
MHDHACRCSEGRNGDDDHDRMHDRACHPVGQNVSPPLTPDRSSHSPPTTTPTPRTSPSCTFPAAASSPTPTTPVPTSPAADFAKALDRVPVPPDVPPAAAAQLAWNVERLQSGQEIGQRPIRYRRPAQRPLLQAQHERHRVQVNSKPSSQKPAGSGGSLQQCTSCAVHACRFSGLAPCSAPGGDLRRRVPGQRHPCQSSRTQSLKGVALLQ